jgi:hypothetical protein
MRAAAAAKDDDAKEPLIPPAIVTQLRRMIADYDAVKGSAAVLYDRRQVLVQQAENLKAEINRLQRAKAAARAATFRELLADVQLQIKQLDDERAAARSRSESLVAPLRAIATELKVAPARTIHLGTHSINSLRDALQSIAGRSQAEHSGALRGFLDISHPVADELKDLRDKIAAAKRERQVAATAPYSTADLRKRISACLDVSAGSATLDHLSALAYPPREGTPYAFDLGMTEAHWMLLERLRREQAIVDFVQAGAGKESRPSEPARQKSLAKSDADLVQLEAAEESVILNLERTGRIVARRADISAGVVIDVWRSQLAA